DIEPAHVAGNVERLNLDIGRIFQRDGALVFRDPDGSDAHAVAVQKLHGHVVRFGAQGPLVGRDDGDSADVDVVASERHHAIATDAGRNFKVQLVDLDVTSHIVEIGI